MKLQPDCAVAEFPLEWASLLSNTCNSQNKCLYPHPQIPILKPNFQCDDPQRQGLWEVKRGGWRISVLIKRLSKLFTPLYQRTQQENSYLEPGTQITRFQNCQSLVGLSNIRTTANHFISFLSHLVYGTL